MTVGSRGPGFIFTPQFSVGHEKMCLLMFSFFFLLYIFFFFSVFRNRTTCTKNLIQNRTGVHTIVNTQIPRVSHHTTIVEFQVPSLKSWVIGFEVSCVSILGLKSKIFFFPRSGFESYFVGF